MPDFMIALIFAFIVLSPVVSASFAFSGVLPALEELGEPQAQLKEAKR